MFIERTDVDGPRLWSPDAKNLFIGKDPDAGKNRGQEEMATKDKTVGWHH